METIKSKMSGDLEQACLWLLRSPIDEFCLDVKHVSVQLVDRWVVS